MNRIVPLLFLVTLMASCGDKEATLGDILGHDSGQGDIIVLPPDDVPSGDLPGDLNDGQAPPVDLLDDLNDGQAPPADLPDDLNDGQAPPADLPGDLNDGQAPPADLPDDLNDGQAPRNDGQAPPADLPGDLNDGQADRVEDIAPDIIKPEDIPADGPALPLPQVGLEAPSTWQRGPVSLLIDVAHEGGEALGASVEFSTDSETFLAATALAGYGDALEGRGSYRFVWDSFADLQDDHGEVFVRVTAQGEGGWGEPVVAGPFAVLDRPDRPRVVLVTSSINGNDKVRRLVWHSETGLEFNEDDVFQVGRRPARVIFEPGGKSAVTLDQDDNTLSFFALTGEGDVANILTVPTPDRYLVDGAYSGDGALLYLLDGNPRAFGGGIYVLECDPWTGLPLPDAEPTLLLATYVASTMALLPEGQGFVLLGANESDPGGSLLLMVASREGVVLDEAPLGPEGSLVGVLAVSPDGAWALASYANLFGYQEEAVLVGLSPEGLMEVGGAVAVTDPAGLAFHSTGQSAILAQAYANRVLSLVLGSQGSLSAGTELRLDLAGSIAHPLVGPDRDLFLVTTVSSSTGLSGLAVYELDATGGLLEYELFDIGGGTDVIPQDVGIQP